MSLTGIIMEYGILIGIILTILYYEIIFPIKDLKIEQYRYYISKKCTKDKLDADEMCVKFNREYPEVKEQNEKQQESTNVIGFHMDSDNEDLDFDDDFDEE